MARKQMTKAHRAARTGWFRCVKCGRPFTNAKYEGECTYVYRKDGSDKMISVYLRCRCRVINEVSMDMDDPFYDVVDDVQSIPHRAQKITTAQEMAEESLSQ